MFRLFAAKRIGILSEKGKNHLFLCKANIVIFAYLCIRKSVKTVALLFSIVAMAINK
ncbi:hypothetical protein HMPREF0663_11508 [Hoylesella oralis ATCC 33269]|uniref:Uncharacterized protein n=1 Tax=Hoylesella oralis ATCC 33269 TaxID=873533 RepID=E7RQQ7_9BACT|nr:hypothetical protein HMPREF0663_11508 [Hoylesella oralis ATCC 33269]